MKPKPLQRFRSARAGALTTFILLACGSAHAVDIAATGNQVSPEEWNLATWAGGQWSGGLAPSAGNTYSTGAFQIRTLNSTTLNTTFGGDSLRIVAGGSLLLRNGNANFVNGNLILDGGTLISGRALTGGNAQDVAGNLNIASASFIDLTNSGAGNQNRITYQSGNFTGNGDITMSGNESTDVLSLETTLIGSHTGNWTINGGRLVVTNDNHIGNSASVTMGSATAAFLEIRSDQTIGSLSGNGTVQASGTRILTTGGDGTDTDFSGVISNTGAISLVKEGGGKFTLSNSNNTFTGPITINGGTLEFSNTNGGNNVFASTQININGASTLRVSGTAANVPIFANRSYTFNSVGGGKIELGAGGNYDAGVANQPFSITTQGGAQNTIKIINDGVSGANGFNLGGSVATFDITLGSHATSDLAVTPIMSNNGSVLKTGNGRLTLAGANTYLGTTTVSNGTLLVNGNQSVATGAVTVASGATLGGTGTIGGTLAVTGILAPGEGGIESLDVTNEVTWKGAASEAAQTIWQFELGAFNTADLLNITGNFTKDDSAGSVFGFNFMNSNVNGTFKLVDWSGSTTFLASDFSYSNLGGGRTGSFSFNGSSLEFTAVPEPTSALAGLLLTAGLLRRRRK